MAERPIDYGEEGVAGWGALASVRTRLRIIEECFVEERDRWFLWMPVGGACGIGLYFTVSDEPPAMLAPLVGLLAAVALALTRAGARERGSSGLILGAVLSALLVGSAGFAIADLRAALVAAPVVTGRIVAVDVRGRLADIERRPDGRIRLVMDAPRIEEMTPAEAPARIRLTSMGAAEDYLPGDAVSAKAVLLPPSPPVAPGAFDFARQAWFGGLGATGFTLGRPRHIAEDGIAPMSVRQRIDAWTTRLRTAVEARVLARMDEAEGAVAAALMTGRRGAIPEDVTAAFRDAGLAHLLAISGLHMGMLAGLLFFALRALFALSEHLTLAYPIKKWAAAGALLGAFGYLVLSGASVSTERAFLMTGAVLLAVLLDRSVVSMRLVAWAALVVLAFAPESLMEAGFQMSFAAVVALVAFYEVVRTRWPGALAPSTWRGRIRLYFLALVLTTIVADLAIAPFAAYNFNRVASYSLLGNLLAGPVMGLVIMPSVLAALALMPLGLENLALQPLETGLEALIAVARRVQSLPGAVMHVPATAPAALAVATLGGLWLCLWHGRWRRLGLAGIAAGALIASLDGPPDILVSDDGKLVAVRGSRGEFAMSSTTGSRFTRESWLQRAGTAASQRWPSSGADLALGLSCDRLACLYERKGRRVSIVRDARALAEDCRRADIVVSLVPVFASCREPAVIVDRFDLWRAGAHAVWIGKEKVRIETVAEARGRRPWTRDATRR